MQYLIGNPNKFAIELEIISHWKNKTAIWINNARIGNWEDENILAPFIKSLYRIAIGIDNLVPLLKLEILIKSISFEDARHITCC